MTTNRSQKAFDTGKAWRNNQRKQNPMSFSNYKIVETGEYWSDFLDELITIGRCASGDKTACYGLMHCGKEDKAFWVKRLPESMLESFSRDVVEVLYALRGDGIQQREIDYLERMVNLAAPRLIELGELARLEAKNDWPHVSKSLASGNGYIYQFVAEMQSLVTRVVDEINANLRRLSGGELCLI